MFLELSDAIRQHGFTNYMDFYEFVADTYEDINYFEVFRTYSSHFERLTRGNYQRWEQGRLRASSAPSQGKAHEKPTEKPTEDSPLSCPNCGSIDIVKRGKTAADSQIWGCKDCGKKFVGG